MGSGDDDGRRKDGGGDGVGDGGDDGEDDDDWIRAEDPATCDATRIARRRPSYGHKTITPGPPEGHLGHHRSRRRRLLRRLPLHFRQGCPIRTLAI